jgi:hypothetical protein
MTSYDVGLLNYIIFRSQKPICSLLGLTIIIAGRRKVTQIQIKLFKQKQLHGSIIVEIIGRIETYDTRCSDYSRRGYDLAFMLSSYLTSSGVFLHVFQQLCCVIG